MKGKNQRALEYSGHHRWLLKVKKKINFIERLRFNFKMIHFLFESNVNV